MLSLFLLWSRGSRSTSTVTQFSGCTNFDSHKEKIKTLSLQRADNTDEHRQLEFLFIKWARIHKLCSRYTHTQRERHTRNMTIFDIYIFVVRIQLFDRWQYISYTHGKYGTHINRRSRRWWRRRRAPQWCFKIDYSDYQSDKTPNRSP